MRGAKAIIRIMAAKNCGRYFDVIAIKKVYFYQIVILFEITSPKQK